MSIALTGPKMYDFQDLVCTNFILQFYKKNEVTFFAEPDAAEDARLVFTEDTHQPIFFEIQVKGSKEAVSLGSLAECLAHFPARKATNFLLEQLLADQNMCVVLIMSGRTLDAAQKYVPKGHWDGGFHNENIFVTDDASQLLEELRGYSDSLPDVKIKGNRKRYLEVFLEAMSLSDLKQAMSRLIVLERVSFDSLKRSCSKVLRKDFNIPDDMLEATILGLSECIKESKTLQVDAIPLVYKKLNEAPVLSVQPKNYVVRGQETLWVNQLKESNVLLLSGKPRVGKSDAAKWVAREFQKQGYSILLTPHIDEAERFLQDTVKSHRLAVLDDPLGGGSSYVSSRVGEKLRQLKGLVPSLRQDRKLIIAQGQERLLEVTESEVLSEASLRGIQWVDLSKPSAKFLLDCWISLEKGFSIKQQLYLKIYKAIEDEKFEIETGCLAYLASEHEKIDSSMDLDEILRFARKDADDLGRELADDGCRNLLMGLAITTSHLESVSELDLSYVLSAKGELDYGYTGSIATNIFGEERVHEFPQYPGKLELEPQNVASLNLLELRRILELGDGSLASLIFTHPYYKSAAESLCNVSTRSSFSEVERILTNGIFCLSPDTARATARNLHWIYEKTKRQSFKDRIVDKAILGLNSSYPSVRDLCFEFLCDIFENLDDKYKEKQDRWIYKVYGKELTALEWLNGEPWYPMGEHVIVSLSLERYLGEENVSRVINILNRNENIPLKPKDSYDILRYLEGKPEELTHNVMSRILSVNEGLIRALAAKVWVQIDRANDLEILERIFKDRHPAVAKSVFRSSIKSWDQFDEDRQNYIFSKLVKTANQPVVAHAIIDDLVVFERSHRIGENPPWSVFAELLPIALSSLPASHRLDYARLDCVVREAAQKIPLSSLIPVLEAWTGLLEKTAIHSEPDDYAFGVIDHFLSNTKKDHNVRRGFVERLLRLNGTGPLVRVVSDLTNFWTDLSNGEKETVKELLTQNRVDKNWLKAAVLTSHIPPPELLDLVTGKEYNDRLQVNDILDLEPDLLDAGFKVYIGSPQPLWWYATHHREQQAWPEIAERISYLPNHPLFKIAFMNLLEPKNNQKICRVVKKLGPDYAEVLFELVMGYYMDSNPEFMPEVWEALFSLTEDSDTHSLWIKRLASNSLVIFDSLLDANKLIPAVHVEEYYSHFPNDFALLNLILLSKRMLEYEHKEELAPSTTKDEMLTNLRTLFEQMPPSHYFVCDPVQNLLKRFDCSDEEVSFAKLARSELLDIKHSWKKSYEVEKISNWHY